MQQVERGDPHQFHRVALVLNKTDSADEGVLQNALEFASSLRLQVVKCSAKTGENVQQLFQDIAERYAGEYLQRAREKEQAEETKKLETEKAEMGRRIQGEVKANGKMKKHKKAECC